MNRPRALCVLTMVLAIAGCDRKPGEPPEQPPGQPPQAAGVAVQEGALQEV